MFISTIGMLIGIAIFGILADKIGRRKTFAIYYIGGTGIHVSFTSSYSQIQHYYYGKCIAWILCKWNDGRIGAILAENYPAEARSTAENFIFGTGRGLAGFGPVSYWLTCYRWQPTWSIVLDFYHLPNQVNYNATMCTRNKGKELD